MRLGNKKEKKCFFILYCSHLSLSLNKIGGGSAIKIKKLCFFILYCSRLSLSLNKIGCGSEIKKKKSVFSFCIALAFHYLCIYILCNDRKRLWNYQ